MKRQHDRDGSPKSNRQYQGYSEYSSRERLSTERDRRDRNSRHEMRDREYDYDRMSTKRHTTSGRDSRDSERYNRSTDREGQPYRTLCISNFPHRVQDNEVRDALYKEFASFGEFNVKIAHSNYNDNGKIAFVNFRYHENAREARHEMTNKLYLFDAPSRIEPVYNNRPYEGYQNHNWRDRGSQYSGGSTQTGRQGYDNRDRDGYRMDQGRRQEHGREGAKFPHHLNHIEPEDDDKATRTLFVGNLEVNIEESVLRDSFARFGQVTDIDIKRPMSGNAYAFVKFFNLDMAHLAKVTMSGQYISGLQCKIGYGKASPSVCIWVGGLGPWLNVDVLEREFDRFGMIHLIEWPQDCNYAYVVYDSLEVAQEALKEMRGYPLGGPEHRLRVDYAELSQLSAPLPAELKPHLERELKAKEMSGKDQSMAHSHDRVRTSSRNDWASKNDLNGDRTKRDDQFSDGSDRKRSSRSFMDDMDRSRRSGSDMTPSRDRDSDHMLSPVSKRARLSPSLESNNHNNSSYKVDCVEKAESLTDLVKCLQVVWNGALVLKNSAFLTRLYLVSGDVHLVDNLLRDPTSTEMPVLKITQRLRLDKQKIEDVTKRISHAGPSGSCVLLAQTASSAQLAESMTYQSRPLKNLVSYLKQKDAAGIISLPPNPNAKFKDAGVLHAIPPCQFGYEFLTKKAPKMQLDFVRDDHLVVVVIQGSG